MHGEKNRRQYFQVWHFIQVLAVMESQGLRMAELERNLKACDQTPFSYR